MEEGRVRFPVGPQKKKDLIYWGFSFVWGPGNRIRQRGSGKLGISPCRKTANEVSVRNLGFLRRSTATTGSSEADSRWVHPSTRFARSGQTKSIVRQNHLFPPHWRPPAGGEDGFLIRLDNK